MKNGLKIPQIIDSGLIINEYGYYFDDVNFMGISSFYHRKRSKVIDEINNFITNYRQVETEFSTSLDIFTNHIHIEIYSYLNEIEEDDIKIKINNIAYLNGVYVTIKNYYGTFNREQLKINKIHEGSKISTILLKDMKYNKFRFDDKWNLINSGIPEHNHRCYEQILETIIDIIGRNDIFKIKWIISQHKKNKNRDEIILQINNKYICLSLFNKLKKHIHKTSFINGSVKITLYYMEF